MESQRRTLGKKEPEPSAEPEQIAAATPSRTPSSDFLPDLPGYDPEPADGVRVGESPVPGLTLKRILRGHTDLIHRIAWSPDGRLLASPSKDRTIRIWDVALGECTAILEGHKGTVNSVTWSPDGHRLASSSGSGATGRKDFTVRIWDTANWKTLHVLREHDEAVYTVAWSPDGHKLASGSADNTVRIWDVKTGSSHQVLQHSKSVMDVVWSVNGKFLACGSNDRTASVWNAEKEEKALMLEGHSGPVSSIAWSPDGRVLVTGGAADDSTIRVWDAKFGQEKIIVEGHTKQIWSLSFSVEGKFLSSKSGDGTVRIWTADTWLEVARLEEPSVWKPGGPFAINILATTTFHPNLPILATLGEDDKVIRVWELNTDILSGGEGFVDSVRYTTAKLVLVGDSGVGKTGLGWRLAHGEFKEHSSTHGQQFWVIPELGTKREDGAECEAVLWDLAGQHVYRQIHSIFLDNVDTSLVLFDPSNRQDPLKGAEFWVEQLKGDGQLPPSVLVGARVDRGAPALSLDYLDQFCQRYGISGGYLSTSAKEDIGLDELMEILRAQIPWEEMTTTVTTVTFKRIKDYVLALKEKPDRQGVLVSPAELRAQLEASQTSEVSETSEVWTFSDAEMMTAVGHLETHGYVTILTSSSGDKYILLAPDLLVDLASSIVLLADKHPRELGAVSETELLQGRHAFDDLEGLEEEERQILLDAAVLRFLEHSVCFRETFGDETLLIFPGLIKQKRPLEDDFPATDDVSYVVRGRVENLYAMLVVLLGYTPSFMRINQWQNQAQYEMGQGEICGFRTIEDREGEIELVLYYHERMPQKGQEEFQALFERFLYQRQVEVTRFPPVICPEGHRLERATVVGRIREGKTFAFCAECGGRTELPKLDEPGIGIGAAVWLRREEAAARLRSTYEQHLVRVKGYRRGWATPRCYLSRAPGEEDCAQDLVHDLRDAGVYIVEEAAQVGADDYVVILDTRAYQQAWKKAPQLLAEDRKLVQTRMEDDSRHLISIKLEGGPRLAASHDLEGCGPGDFCDATHYPVSLFNLVLNLYAIPFTHAGFAPLRASLHRQWEEMPKEAPNEIGTEALEVQAVGAEGEEEGGAPVEAYVDFDLHIGPGGHATASSPQGQARDGIPTEIPSNIRLSLRLIEQNTADADLLKDVGLELYKWLFPGPIHTHFHQTEAVARAQRASMRLRLQVEVGEIFDLPLEFIYRETGGYYMAINPDTVLSRYLGMPLPPERVRRREGPLHMLAIISDPTNMERLPPDEWEGILETALEEPLASGQMTLQMVKQATRREISRALLKQDPDIIQFVGHGRTMDGKGYLALVDEDTGELWRVDDERFANLFLGHDDNLGLICLATCESAKAVGVAPKLVERGVPAVVAMQYMVNIETAKVFLESFYSAVAARKPVDWATQSARRAISVEYGLDNREFATPVLYMRAKDGQVF